MSSGSMCLPQSMSSSKNCGTKGSLQVANSPGRCFRCLGRHSLNPARTKTHTMPEAQVPLQSSHSQTRSPLSFLLWVIGMSAFCRPFGSPGNGFVMKIHHRYQILALFTFSVARNGKQPLFARTKTEIAQKTMGSCPSCFLEFGFLLSSSLC